MQKWRPEDKPGLVGCTILISGSPHLTEPHLSLRPWQLAWWEPLALTCCLSLSWVKSPHAALSDHVSHKGSGSCGHFWVQRKYMWWGRRSGFPSSCPTWRCYTVRPLGQETSEPEHESFSHPPIDLLRLSSSIKPFWRCLSVWPSNRLGLLVVPQLAL